MHRRISARGRDFIKQCEGFSNLPYLCSSNFLTIGYGHKITKSATLTVVTQEIAEEILKKDLYQAERAVLKYINVPLHDDQFAALVSFTFNLGGGALQRSTLRQKVNYESHAQAATEFLKWVYADGKILKGLILRRQRESFLYAGEA